MSHVHDLPFLKAKYNMTTFDDDLVKASSDFMDKAKRDGKPFFIWHNTTRMHVWTFLSDKCSSMQNSQVGYGLEEAGMAQLDDSVGALLKHLEDIGETNNTIVIFSGLDWFPTLLDAAGNPNITDQLLKGVKLGDRT